jgi:hypothetical protein
MAQIEERQKQEGKVFTGYPIGRHPAFNLLGYLEGYPVHRTDF